jgi:KaiC/GvpD/RAD55 family RecA-like ATPase
MYIGGALNEAVERMPVETELVAGLLPFRSVNVLVGDSGVGKTPLVHQLALAVAAGIPFLGAATQRSRVLLLDYENGRRDANRMLEQQRKHLGLDTYPSPTFVYWPVDSAAPQARIAAAIRNMAPRLLIIDSLRSFCPTFENGNTAAVEQIKRLRTLSTQCGTCVLLVHHVHKRRSPTSLENGIALDWLLAASGARALINQTDVRLAFARSREIPDGLILRGQRRTHGEVGPFHLTRRLDISGKPLGYELSVTAATPLKNPKHEAAFALLPEVFTFGQAKAALGKNNKPTNSFLHKLLITKRVQKTGWGVYKKGRQQELSQ